MRVRRSDVSSACALLLLLCSTRVHAADLRWRGPAECERKDNVAAQVERLIGRPLADVTAVDFEVQVRRAPDASWQLAVQTVVPQDAVTPHARELRGATCEEVADAAALAIAMAVQERAAESAAVPADSAAATATAAAPGDASTNTPPPVAAAPPAPPPSEPPDADANALRFGIGLGVLLDAGALPSLAPGGQVEFSGAYAALRVSLFGSAFVPQREDLPGEDRGGEFQLVLGGIRLCAAPRFGQVHVMGCTGFELGQMTGEGRNVRQSRTQHAGWRAVLSEVGVSWEFIPQFAGVVRVGTAWPLSRPEFVLDGTTAVHRPSGLSFRLLIGLELYL